MLEWQLALEAAEHATQTNTNENSFANKKDNKNIVDDPMTAQNSEPIESKIKVRSQPGRIDPNSISEQQIVSRSPAGY